MPSIFTSRYGPTSIILILSFSTTARLPPFPALCVCCCASSPPVRPPAHFHFTSLPTSLLQSLTPQPQTKGLPLPRSSKLLSPFSHHHHPPPTTLPHLSCTFQSSSIHRSPSNSPKSQDEVLNHSRCRCPLCIRGRTASRSPTMCCKFSSSSSSIITSPSLN